MAQTGYVKPPGVALATERLCRDVFNIEATSKQVSV
jgi:hypothetical protein